MTSPKVLTVKTVQPLPETVAFVQSTTAAAGEIKPKTPIARVALANRAVALIETNFLDIAFSFEVLPPHLTVVRQLFGEAYVLDNKVCSKLRKRFHSNTS
jgi:hypothetical protein